MVMVTRNAFKRACESSHSSDVSEKNIIPPWCSSACTVSGKVNERKPRRVASRWEIQSSYPLRENIWEYLYEDSSRSNFNRRRKRTKQTVPKPQVKRNGACRIAWILLMFLLVSILLLLSLWITNPITRADLLTKVIPKAKLISLFGNIQSSMSEECCNKMRYLEAELARAEEILRKSHRLRRVLMLTSQPKIGPAVDRHYIEGATATKGSDTEEWGGRVALWGVVPLWRAAPPPDTILSLRNPTPSDCWPISGSEGDIVIKLPQMKRVNYVSVEHVYPDTAKSAPKEFVLFGVLGNDTWIKAVDGQYHNKGPAKQYYSLTNRGAPMKSIVFRVLSNHGNPKYTCIYRVHLYESVMNEFNII